MDAELAKILDAAGLTGDARAEAEKAFNNEALGKVLKDGTLMRSDYSRKMDELAATRRTLEANWDKANKEYIEMQGDLDATRAEQATAAAKLKEAEDKLAAAAAVPKADPIDTSKFLTLEQIAERERRFAAGQTAFFADSLEAIDRIKELTGTKVTARTLVQEAMAAGKTPLEYAEEKYSLSAKESELTSAARTKEIEDARNEGYNKGLSEGANPATRPLTASRDPFYVPKDGGTEPMHPWDMTGPAPDETALLAELEKARA